MTNYLSTYRHATQVRLQAVLACGSGSEGIQLLTMSKTVHILEREHNLGKQESIPTLISHVTVNASTELLSFPDGSL